MQHMRKIHKCRTKFLLFGLLPIVITISTIAVEGHSYVDDGYRDLGIWVIFEDDSTSSKG